MLERRPKSRLGSRRSPATHVRTRPPEVSIQIPLQLRQPLNEIVDLAEELETRAQTVKWMSESRGATHAQEILRLQSMAALLRDIAVRVMRRMTPASSPR